MWVFFVDVQKDAGTRLRGVEEVCGTISPSDGTDLPLLFSQRIRTTSAMSSIFSDEELNEEGWVVYLENLENSGNFLIKKTQGIINLLREFL